MPYKRVILYYMSGTGNSYRVATWIGQIATASGAVTKVIPITNANHLENIKKDDDCLVGLVFPAHGFTVPWLMLKFAFGLPPVKSVHSFCVASRGSLKIGKLHIPGMSGSATFVIALILKLKGYRVQGAMSVNMPSNWFTLHPIQRNSNLQAIITRAKHRVNEFSENIISARKVWFTTNNLYEFIGGSLLSYVSFLYLLMGRFFLAKLFFANSNCNACEICVKNCPVHAIELRGRKNKRPFWKYNCESCMRCASICPNHAVESGQSWGIILYFAIMLPLTGIITIWLSRNVPLFLEIRKSALGIMTDILPFYAVIFTSYVIFQMLIRIRFINWLFTHTTFTHFGFWGRYKEPKVKLNKLMIPKE